MTDADKCRKNRWIKGTYLVGDEGYGPSVIKITAIGESAILARLICHNWKPPEGSTREHHWTLDCRDWRRIHLASVKRAMNTLVGPQ